MVRCEITEEGEGMSGEEAHVDGLLDVTDICSDLVDVFVLFGCGGKTRGDKKEREHGKRKGECLPMEAMISMIR
jgi:hypothetical protein